MNIGAQRAILAAKSEFVKQTFRGNVYRIKPSEISNVLDMEVDVIMLSRRANYLTVLL
jgi:hypothetical protein